MIGSGMRTTSRTGEFLLQFAVCSLEGIFVLVCKTHTVAAVTIATKICHHGNQSMHFPPQAVLRG